MGTSFRRRSTKRNIIREIEAFLYPPRFVLVRIKTDLGVAYGDATLEGQPFSVVGTLQDVRHHFIDKDADELDLVQATLRACFYANNPVLRSLLGGIDIALHDLKARLLGIPLWSLLGSLVHPNGLPYYCWTGGHTPEPGGPRKKGSAANMAVNLIRTTGVRQIKLNACPVMGSLDMEDEIDHAARVARDLRRAVGPDVKLCFDAHGRCTPPLARKLLAALMPYDPYFIEEPMEEEYDDDMPALRGQAGGVYIATGERMHTPGAFKKLVARGGVDILQPDLVHVGGIGVMREILGIATSAGLTVAPHCPLSILAFMACYHLMITSRAGRFLECANHLHYNREGQGNYRGNPWLRLVSNGGIVKLGRSGLMRVPKEPGLGLIINEDQIVEGRKNAVPWTEFRGEIKTGEVVRM